MQERVSAARVTVITRTCPAADVLRARVTLGHRAPAARSPQAEWLVRAESLTRASVTHIPRLTEREHVAFLADSFFYFVFNNNHCITSQRPASARSLIYGFACFIISVPRVACACGGRRRSLPPTKVA
ncbi:hypothetical protein RR46_05462 [Papilio xuthus]|uniref:Uncharacterized protein n=1 Tax=Papilio xuthus TaxID=66420 RepID=A0A194Q1S5_PAPXU|nr:hypothetical protein RR46_05462 [Papilio xuthus]